MGRLSASGPVIVSSTSYMIAAPRSRPSGILRPQPRRVPSPPIPEPLRLVLNQQLVVAARRYAGRDSLRPCGKIDI